MFFHLLSVGHCLTCSLKKSSGEFKTLLCDPAELLLLSQSRKQTRDIIPHKETNSTIIYSEVQYVALYSNEFCSWCVLDCNPTQFHTYTGVAVAVIAMDSGPMNFRIHGSQTCRGGMHQDPLNCEGDQSPPKGFSDAHRCHIKHLRPLKTSECSFWAKKKLLLVFRENRK